MYGMELNVFGTLLEINESYLEQPEEVVHGQLTEYFKGDRTVFELGVTAPDSFTGRVMDAMMEIPCGETRSYGEIAETLETAAVAVGQACGRNPVPVVVPCHRVVSSQGPGGYGYGTELKKRLLAHEKSMKGS